MVQLNDSDRIWIFSSSNDLNSQIQDQIITQIESFLSQWEAHGKELVSRVWIENDRFIIIAVNESFEKASGCSIDKMMKFISQIEQRFELNLTDRSLIYYENENESIISQKFNEIRGSVNSGKISENTIIYNTAINSGSQFKNDWKLKAGESWISKYFQNNPV